jgi:hypothetical protein
VQLFELQPLPNSHAEPRTLQLEPGISAHVLALQFRVQHSLPIEHVDPTSLHCVAPHWLLRHCPLQQSIALAQAPERLQKIWGVQTAARFPVEPQLPEQHSAPPLHGSPMR